MRPRTWWLYSLLLLSNTILQPAYGQYYKISFTSNSKYAPFPFGNDSIFYKSRIVLEAGLRVRSVQDNTRQLFAQLDLTPKHLQIMDEGLSREPDTAAVARFLSKPVYIRYNDSGRVMQVYFDTAVSVSYRQLWNQLIGYMQCIVPATEQQEFPSWEITEEDRIGFFRTRYQQVKATRKKETRFRKKGTGYTTFEGKGLVDYVQQLDADYILDQASMKDMVLEEILQLTVKGKNKATTTSTCKLHIDTIAAARQSLEDNQAFVQQLRRNIQVSAEVTLSNFITRQESKRSLYRQLLGQQTMHDILQAIDTLTLAEAKADKEKINRRVAALVYLQPTLLDSFMVRMAKDTALSPTFQVVVKGFIHAATPLAQAGIGELLKQNRDKPTVVDFFTNALLFMEQPDPAFIATVQAIAYSSQQFDRPVQEALRYLLGSFSYTLKKSDPSLATATILNTWTAIKKYSRKPEKEKVIELLGIAGNAGNNSTFAEISTYVNNPDEDIRLQALFAIRLVDTAAVDTLLLHELKSDTTPTTRMTILSVFRYRAITPQVINAVILILSGTKDESLAIQSVRLLYENKKAFPEVITVLKKIEAQATSPVLKKEIMTLLSEQ